MERDSSKSSQNPSLGLCRLKGLPRISTVSGKYAPLLRVKILWERIENEESD
jgi:hypothetical protein